MGKVSAKNLACSECWLKYWTASNHLSTAKLLLPRGHPRRGLTMSSLYSMPMTIILYSIRGQACQDEPRRFFHDARIPSSHHTTGACVPHPIQVPRTRPSSLTRENSTICANVAMGPWRGRVGGHDPERHSKGFCISHGPTPGLALSPPRASLLAIVVAQYWPAYGLWYGYSTYDKFDGSTFNRRVVQNRPTRTLL